MVPLLLTSVVVLGLLAIAIYFWQKPANRSQTIELPLPPDKPRGLFSDFRINQLRSATESQPVETPKVDAETFQHAIQAIKAFQESPNRSSTAELLHAAALSDNAKNYGRAIELMASGGGTEGGGGIGTLLLLNLFRDRLNIPGPNGDKVTTR